MGSRWGRTAEHTSGGGEGEVLLLLLQTAQSHLHVCVPRTFFVFFRFKNVFRGPLTACVCDARP